jgi:hypothetical protein
MQQQVPGHQYHLDRMASSQHVLLASHDRVDVSRMGQDYHAHQVERPHYDGRFPADSRGRLGIGLEFPSRGSEHSQTHVPSSRSPGRNFPPRMFESQLAHHDNTV